ncbi:MAG: LysR family transcriptional regulator [Ramlibacter sp.]|nr:LysR family transcriptional regulator [Ramlibacter sp.]
MDLKRLNHLVALAEDCNFRKAAERVHLSQPAFSRSIQAAEEELGMQLFDRTGAQVSCTPAGAFVIERARRVLLESRRLDRDVHLFNQGQIGEVSFGAGPMATAALLPALMTDLRQRFPDVKLRVHVNNPHYLLDYVKTEEHDFFVGDTRDVPKGGPFAVRLIGRQSGAFYARATHPLFGQKTINLADMIHFGIASGRLPLEINAYLLRVLGLGPEEQLPTVVECDDVHLLRRIALDTDTIIVSTETILADELAAGRIRPMQPADLAPAHSEVGIVTLEGRLHSPVAQYAIDALAHLARATSPPSWP